ncbi:DUF778 domain containing protein [Nitzschia inconspicua]|uniref:DUF778 domain containing protein n=1 Tax=Nitzschia inconspicua TaxID=303405 RepID=A0A9K3PRI5_9STRA|nr:DUF778 domain containing protein [Nitzschia inconspicua]
MTSRALTDLGTNNKSGSIDLEQSNINGIMHPSSKISTTAMAPSNNSIISDTTTRIPDFSFCILWSPLPIITWIIPFIGHLGIADSRGYSHDFQGPYSIGTSRKAVMAFGPTTRYLKMDIGQLSTAERWDDAIREADRIYSGRMHNLFCDNCHSHVAKALNLMPYGGGKWNMVKLCFLVFFRGTFVSFGGFLCQFLPFLIFVFLIVLFRVILGKS